MSETTNLTIRLPADLRQKFRDYCRSGGFSQSKLIAIMIQDRLDMQEFGLGRLAEEKYWPKVPIQGGHVHSGEQP